MKNLTLLFIFLFYLFCAVTSAEAVNYYVGVQTGDSDANSCATAQTNADGSRKRTINGGISCLSPGDTLTIRVGTYDENLAPATTRSGTSWAAPTTIKAATGELVTITGNIALIGTGNSTPTINCDSGPAFHKYFVFDGLTLDGTTEGLGVSGLIVTGCSRKVKFQNGTINNFASNGFSCTTGDNPPGRDLDIDCQLINSRVTATGPDSSQSPAERPGLYFAGTTFLIENSELDNNSCCGLTLNSTTNAIVRGNIIRNNGERGINVAGKNNQIYRNRCYDDGVSLGCISVRAAGTKVWNNTVNGNGKGIEILSTGSDTEVKNNIATNNTTDISNAGTGTVFDNNLCDAAGTGCESVGNPLYANVGAKDFSLLGSSPAIDAGVNVGLPFNGSAPDQGALESVGSGGGPPIPIGAQVQNGTPNVVNLQWSASATGVNSCAAAGFVVNVAGGNRTSTGLVQVDGTNTNVTFDGAAVTAGQAILVSYSGTSCQGNSQPIAAFSNFTATNGVAATIPVPTGAEVKTISPNVVNLTWQTVANPVTGCTAGNFSVTVAAGGRTVTGLSQVSSFKTDLTFDGAQVTPGQTVTVTYAGTSCQSGGTIANFTGFAVTNNVVAQGGFSSGQIVTATPNVVNVTFQSTVDPITACLAVDFTVNVATVNRTTSSIVMTGASTANITFGGAAVTAGQAVTLAYAGTSCKAGTTTISTWTAQPVSNNVGGGAASWVLAQTGFRIRDFYGNETGAGWKAPLNTNYTLCAGCRARPRIELTNTGTVAAPAVALVLQRSIDSGAWTNVLDTCSPTNVCVVGTAPDSQLPEDGASTTQQIGSGSFTACQVKRTQFSIPTVTLGAGFKTECEAVVAFGSSLATGTTIDFRWQQDEGSSVSVFNQTPRFVIIAAQAGGL